MKKTKTKAKIWLKMFLIFGLFFFATQNIFAEELPDNEEEKVTVRVLANTGIDDAKIIKQAQNKFTLSFNLSNNGQAQPGVTYLVQLLKREGEKTEIWDEQIYPEVVSLAEKETVSREIDYTAPSYLKGSYELWMMSKNTSGLLLSLVKVGNTEVDLNGDEKFVEINPSSCYLKIKGEEDKYFLKQGLDITEDEQIALYCTATNHFNAELSLTSSIENHFRFTGGEIVESEKITQENYTIGAKEKKEIAISIPRAKKPQAYDAIVKLTNQGKPVSNSVAVHYVIRGESATIQNLRADNDFYAKGDVAKLEINWSPSADRFFGSRQGIGASQNNMSIKASITDDRSAKCAEPVSKDISSAERSAQMSVPIIMDCYNPKITAELVSTSGKTLDSRVYNIQSKKQRVNQEVKIEPKKEESDSKGYSSLTKGFITLAVVLFLALLLLILKKQHNINLFLLLFIASFLLLGITSKVQAGSATIQIDVTYRDWSCLESDPCGSGTFDWSNPFNNCLCYQKCVINKCNAANCGIDEEGNTIDCSNATGKEVINASPIGYTMSLNKDDYNPSETIYAFGSVYYANCSNTFNRALRQYGLSASQISKAGPPKKTFFSNGVNPIPFKDGYQELDFNNVQKEFTADAAFGNYNMKFDGWFQGYLRDDRYVPNGANPAIGTALIPYNVIGAAPTLSASLQAAKDSVNWVNSMNESSPLNDIDLKAAASGTAIGDATYNFDCDNGHTFTVTGNFNMTQGTDECDYSVASGTYTFYPSVQITRQGISSVKVSIPITVTGAAAPPVSCGLAASKDTCQSPSSNLCVNGASGAVTFEADNRYHWTCTGGGITKNCETGKNCGNTWQEVAP